MLRGYTLRSCDTTGWRGQWGAWHEAFGAGAGVRGLFLCGILNRGYIQNERDEIDTFFTIHSATITPPYPNRPQLSSSHIISSPFTDTPQNNSLPITLPPTHPPQRNLPTSTPLTITTDSSPTPLSTPRSPQAPSPSPTSPAAAPHAPRPSQQTTSPPSFPSPDSSQEL
jgi:hypothetical protein